ncbi:MAG: DUF3859 domain-containing protein [Flavobacteriales bacterium]|nr:DUF3859 domain-containing protein [Flavobacteriales bacterium]
MRLKFLFYLFINTFYIVNAQEFVEVGYGQFKDNEVYLTVKKDGFNEKIIQPTLTNTEYGKDTLKLEPGVEFGVNYKIIDTSTATTHLIVTWVPPGPLVDETGESFETITWEFATENNKEGRLSIELGDEGDLLPGLWQLIVEYAEDKEFTRNFFLTKE